MQLNKAWNKKKNFAVNKENSSALANEIILAQFFNLSPN